MLSFFKKRPSVQFDLGWMGVDIHSHLLPGIDDGSPDVSTSLGYLRKLEDLGIRKVICTPHVYIEI